MSVIIPVYERVRFLPEALDSVLAQTVQDFEILVVEDGSHAAPAVLERYADPRIHYLWQANQGTGAARNTGARHAAGAWLALLDEDDLWLREKLERQLALSGRFPSLGMIHADCYVLADGQLGPSRRPVPAAEVPSGWVGAELFLRNLVWASSALIRKAEFDRVGGFDPRLQGTDDYHLWIRLARHCPFGFLAEPLWIYRVHDGNWSGNDLGMAVGNVRALESALREIPSLWSECGPAAVRARLHAFRLECALLHYYAGHYAAARNHFLGAWRWRPGDVRSLGYALACAAGGGGLNALRTFKRLLRRPGCPA